MKHTLYGYSSDEQLKRIKELKRCRVISHKGHDDALVTIHKYRRDNRVKITIEVVKCK